MTEEEYERISLQSLSIRVCPTCHGSGVTGQYHTCSTCKGCKEVSVETRPTTITHGGKYGNNVKQNEGGFLRALIRDCFGF